MVGKVVGYHPRVPDGAYKVKYCGYETARSWNAAKVAVKFAIVEGDLAGIPLTRYYNAIQLYDPIGPNGEFDVGDRSHLLKEYRSLLLDVRSTSEIDLDHYKGMVILAQVGTTKKTGTGEELSESNQYSVVRKLLEIVPESYEPESATKLG